MTRLLLLTIAALAIATVALAFRGEASAQEEAVATAVLGVGDTMVVNGSPIGCQVNRRDGRIVIDCRRGGSLARTYGTLFDKRGVRVVRFRSSDTAKVVFKAKHQGRARRCDGARKARR